MNVNLELTLSYDGYHWITDGMDQPLRGKDLHHLENNIAGFIRSDPRFINNKTINVTLLFDMENFPRWLHQYQSHYFNYHFTVTNINMDEA